MTGGSMRVLRVGVTFASILLVAAQGFGQKLVSFAKLTSSQSGAAGANAVVSADVNGDFFPDIVVATNNGVSVILNNGDGTLAPSVTYATGGTLSESLAVVDVNVDGSPDIVVTNMCNNSSGCFGVAVLIGNGDGTFQSAVGYDPGGLETGAVAAGDVDGDGTPDLVLVNNCQPQTCVAGTQALLLNNGDGTFGSPKALTDAKGPVALGDMNNDGIMDLVTGAGVMLGNGDGTFQPANSEVVGGASSITLADLNNDGILDVVSTLPTRVAAQLGDGTGALLAANSYATGGANPLAVTVADFNGDNFGELAVINECTKLMNGGCTGAPSVGVLASNGDGTFKAAVIFGTGGAFGTSVSVGDMDQDGKLDLVASTACVTGSNCNEGTVVALRNNFIAKTTINLMSSLNPAILNDTVIFTATITSPIPVPDGSQVTFFDKGVPVDTESTVGGVATFTTSFTVKGNHSIKATYDGDLYHSASVKALTETVNLYPSTTMLVSAPNPSSQFQTVALTATVSSNAPGGPTGMVTFDNSGTVLGKATLNHGVATLYYFGLPVGTLTINATYKGDTQSALSTGSTTQTVHP